MNFGFTHFLIFSLFLLQTSCLTVAKSNDRDFLFNTQKQSTESQIKKSLSDEEIWTEKKLTYKDYTISPQKKKFDKKQEVSGVLIRKRNKIIKSYFDESESLLTEYRFALFNLYDKKEKQLIIESTLPKSWRYRVFNLYPKFTLIFDSTDYNLGHDIIFLDVDKDGKTEILLDLMSFDYFGVNYRKGWVTPQMVFEFDKNKNHYVFANKRFEKYLLKDINKKFDRIKEIKVNKSTNDHYDSDIYSSVMEVFLTYIYLDKENEAWKIFDNEYDSADKNDVKTEIKKYLAKDYLYQLIQTKKD